MGNKATLQPNKNWIKGVSGNPKGRPPKTITEYLREFGNAVSIEGTLTIETADGKTTKKVIKCSASSDERGKGLTINGLVGLNMYQAALSGDLATQKEILNRTEGAVKQEIKVESENTNYSKDIEIDYSKLTDEELIEYRDLMQKAAEIQKKLLE